MRLDRRQGTGGSPGVEYLDQTLRSFVDLWSSRTLLMPRDVPPELQSPSFYGFAV